MEATCQAHIWCTGLSQLREEAGAMAERGVKYCQSYGHLKFRRNIVDTITHASCATSPIWPTSLAFLMYEGA